MPSRRAIRTGVRQRIGTLTALGHSLAGRVHRADTPPEDDRFGELLINLSHIMHDAPTSADVRQAAIRSWSNRDRAIVAPESVWDLTLVERVRATEGLVLLAPVGPRLTDTPIETCGIEPGPSGTETSFFGVPARVDTGRVVDAFASGRPVWFGWVASGPEFIDGELEPLGSLDTSSDARVVAREITRRCEPLMRTYPDQCRAFQRFWLQPFDPRTASRIDRSPGRAERA